jgi:hypothetical protein
MNAEQFGVSRLVWRSAEKGNDSRTLSYFSLPGFFDLIPAPIFSATLGKSEIYMSSVGRSAIISDRIVRLSESYVNAIVGSIFEQFPDISYVEARDFFQLDLGCLSYPHFSAETINVSTVRLGDHWLGYDKSFQKKIRYFWNRLGREARAEVRLEFNAPSKPENIRRIIDFNRKKIQGQGRVHGINEVGERIVLAASAVHGMDVSLFVGAEIIAGCILFICNESSYLFATGYSEKFARDSPGLVCLVRCVERLHDMGVPEFNLLYGKGDYKIRIGGVETPLYSYVFYRSAKSWLTSDLIVKFLLHSIIKPLRRKVGIGLRFLSYNRSVS